MSKALEIARSYFEASNERDFDKISKLISENTTYSSQNTGIYLGRENIFL